MPEPPTDFTPPLRKLMTQSGVSSFRQLSQESGVPRSQLLKMRRGDIDRIPVGSFVALAQTLKVSVQEVLRLFQVMGVESQASTEEARQDWEREGLNCLESLIIQLPTAAAAARKNESAPAFRLLPLLKPLDQLLEHWQVKAIAAVGEDVSFDPQCHQWMGPSAIPEKGTPVRVSHVGYFHGDRLLHRAKVKPL